MNDMPAVRSTPSVEAFKKYWWNRKNTVPTLVIWIVLIVLNVLLCIEDLLSPNLETDFVLVMFIFLGIYYIIKIVNTPKKLYDKVMKISPDQVETVAFGDIGFTMETKGTNVMDHREIPYVRVSSATFKDGWFFINIDDMITCFFSDSDFIGGTPEELKALLSSKIGSRFTVKM